MPVAPMVLPSDAMRHGEAEAPAEPGTAIAALAHPLESTGFTWFFADLEHLPPNLCPATAAETRAAEARPLGPDREGWLIRRRLARQVVAAARDVDAAAVTISADALRRPVLGGAGEGWHLSFSARGAVALIGIGHQPLGVDLEIETPEFLLPWNILRPDERLWLESLPEPQRQRGFLRIWTAKEALVKGLGQGFRIAPERITLPGSPMIHGHAAHVDIRILPDRGGENRDYPSPAGMVILTREALRVFVSNGETRGKPQGISVAVARANGPKTAGPSLADPANG